MLWDARTSCIEAVVIGPGRAVLSYGRHSLGEGLTMDKARDATFLLTGGWYVGWETSLPCCQSNDNSRRSTGDCPSHNGPQSKGKRAGTSMCKPSTQQCFRFDCTKVPPKNTPGEVGSNHRPLPHQPPEAKITIDVRGTKGHHCPGCHHLPQTMGLKVTGVCY